MQIPTMLGAVITEENYDLVAAMLPNGFLGYSRRKMIGKIVVINEPYLDRPGLTRVYTPPQENFPRVRVPDRPMVVNFRNSWFKKKEFKTKFRFEAAATDPLGFRPVASWDD